MSDLSLHDAIVLAKDDHHFPGKWPHYPDDYADLGDADLPPKAEVHLADMTGRPVGDFEPDLDKYPHPDRDELERVNHE